MGFFDSILKVAAPVAGGLLGGLSSKSATPSTATSSTAIDPRMAEYLYGGAKNLKPGVVTTYDSSGAVNNPETDYITSPGLYGNAQNIYDTNIAQGYQGQTPGQEASTRWTLNNIKGMDPNTFNDITSQGMSAVSGKYDLNPSTGMPAARAGQGALDPTSAMQGFLAGQVDQTGLDAIQKAAFNRANIGYQDQVIDAGRMFSEQIAPNIRSGAVSSGQYGGSRQGIAEGIAARGLNDQLGRNARDLGLANMDMGQELGAMAYRDAKDKQFTISNALNEQALQSQIADNVSMFNANTANMANRRTGLDLISGGYGGNMQVGNDMYNLYGREQTEAQNAQQFPWQQTSNLSGVLQPGAGLGSSTTSTQTQQQNPLTSAIGGGLLGLQAANSFS